MGTPAATGPRQSASPARFATAATAGLLTLLAGLVALVALAVRGPWTRPGSLGTVLVYAAAFAVFACAAWAVTRVPVRVAVPLILAGGVLLQAAALLADPQTSDDSYRYAWDGRVQAAGHSPYTYVPQDPELASLRDDWLFPQQQCSGWFHHPIPDGCTVINRPHVHTIYPPVAEGWFHVVHALTPPGGREPVQAAAAALAVLVTVVLLLVLRRFGQDCRRAALWAWCPLVALEAGNNAHVDVLAALLLVTGLAAVAAGRPVLGGLLCGGAVATKMFPAAGLAAAVRRAPLRFAAAALALVTVSYLPYVLAGGTDVLGYLPGYLKEERYEDGARFALLGVVLPEGLTPVAAVVVIAAALVLGIRAGDPDRPWHSAVTVYGVMLLVLAPAYPWYTLTLVALVALDGRAEWIVLGPAAYAMYFTWGSSLTMDQVRLVQQVAYATALAVVVTAHQIRRRRAATVRAPASFTGTSA